MNRLNYALRRTLFEGLLAFLEPEAVFTFDVPGSGLPLAEAARRTKVKSVAGQHGNVFKLDSFYREAKHFDCFIVWSDKLVNEARLSGFRETRAAPPLLRRSANRSALSSRQSKQHAEMLLVAIGKMCSEIDRPDAVRVSPADFKWTASVLSTVLSRSEMQEIAVTVRGHPSDREGSALQPFRSLERVACQVGANVELSFSEETLAVVTHHSTVALEAIAMGLPVLELITPSRLRSQGAVSYFEPNPLLRVVTNAEDLSEGIGWARQMRCRESAALSSSAEPASDWMAIILEGLQPSDRRSSSA